MTVPSNTPRATHAPRAQPAHALGHERRGGEPARADHKAPVPPALVAILLALLVLLLPLLFAH